MAKKYSSQKKKIFLVGNGSYQNRGCEAITLGTLEIIKKHFHDMEVYSAEFGERDVACVNNSLIKRVQIPTGRWKKSWFLHHTVRRFGINPFRFQGLNKELRRSLIVLALGGDNYSLDYGKPILHLTMQDYIMSLNKIFIIWGASVGPFQGEGITYEKEIIKKLSKVDAIFAREDLTVQYLKSHGLGDIVYRVSDPAFLMEPIKPNPSKLKTEIPSGSIGLNFSPLMSKYVAHGNYSKWYSIVVETIKELKSRFGRPIVLVPHVFKPGNDDFYFLNQIKMDLNRAGIHIVLLPRCLSAPELKWVISQCDCFAGSRTHSTIASLSTKVPTVSFAYSMKAKGINLDVYGNLDHVIEPEALSPGSVAEHVGYLLANRGEISNAIGENLKKVNTRAMAAGKYLKDVLIKGNHNDHFS